MKIRTFAALAFASCALVCASAGMAGAQGSAQTPEYVKLDAMIPMRDGVRLHAVILRPKGSVSRSTEPLPFLMERTPYGVGGCGQAIGNCTRPALARSGYLFVFEDIRGRYKSEGDFVMNRPIVAHDGAKAVDETTDTRDTIDWLLANIKNNSGRVGVLGVSYPGFLAMMAGIDAHPAVKAVSPQAPMTDVWLGDDFFHNGAFRQTYGFDYVQELEAQKTDVVSDSKEDTYNFFLRNVNFAGAARTAGMESLPTARVFLREPSYTPFWQAMAVERHLDQVTVPVLEVGGYYDQEDMWGTQAEYAELHKHDTGHQVSMVLGPWNHGGWANGPGRRLGSDFGSLDFGEDISAEYRDRYEAPFFERYLKGRSGFTLAGVASFRTGANKWVRYDAWPPQTGFDRGLLTLGAGGTLRDRSEPDPAVRAVRGDEALASYVADPADPIPYRNRPIQSTYAKGSKWRTWLAEDQRFLDSRKDIARFTGPALSRDVTVAGDVMADLFASTTGTDGDWVVKLIDQAPDGRQTMIVDEIFRGRYRESFERPQPIAANKVEEYRWSLHGADHTFLKGHRMLVTVQSSWFPLYDRNPQTYVENIMTASAAAYKAQTVTIYAGSQLEFRQKDGSD